MGEVEEFLAVTLTQLDEADAGLHNGTATCGVPSGRTTTRVTLFGAAVTKSGWAEIGPTFTGWRRPF